MQFALLFSIVFDQSALHWSRILSVVFLILNFSLLLTGEFLNFALPVMIQHFSLLLLLSIYGEFSLRKKFLLFVTSIAHLMLGLFALQGNADLSGELKVLYVICGLLFPLLFTKQSANAEVFKLASFQQLIVRLLVLDVFLENLSRIDQYISRQGAAASLLFVVFVLSLGKMFLNRKVHYKIGLMFIVSLFVVFCALGINSKNLYLCGLMCVFLFLYENNSSLVRQGQDFFIGKINSLFEKNIGLGTLGLLFMFAALRSDIDTLYIYIATYVFMFYSLIRYLEIGKSKSELEVKSLSKKIIGFRFVLNVAGIIFGFFLLS